MGDSLLRNQLVAATMEGRDASAHARSTAARDALAERVAALGARSLLPYLRSPPPAPATRHPQEAADWPGLCRETALTAATGLGPAALPCLREVALGGSRDLRRVAIGPYLRLVREAGSPAEELKALRDATIAWDLLIDHSMALLALFPHDERMATRIADALERPG